MHTRAFHNILIATAAVCGGSSATAADAYPAKTMRCIVPFPPGGSVDPLARLVGSKLTPALGQQFIVDNRPGGSGSIGAGIAVREKLVQSGMGSSKKRVKRR